MNQRYPPIAHSRRVWLLGTLRIEHTHQAIRISGSKAQSLLAFLLLHTKSSYTREYLANLLWPDAPPDRVRRNLSDTLYRLRRLLGQGWLVTTDEQIRLAPDLWVDLWEFERLAQMDEPAALEQAAVLYRADLLPEIYDDWILVWRVNLRERYLALLEKLVDIHQAQNNLAEALRYVRLLISAEPLREHNHQTYLRLLGRLNRRNEALVHYEYLQELLQQELGLAPMPETQAIAGAMRQEIALAGTASFSAERTAFTGRISERAQILEAVEAAIAGQGGLIAIEGEAGIGKSRLLREITAGARWRDAVVVAGVATEQPTASPLLPLIEVLGEALAGARAAQVEALLPVQTLAWLGPLYPLWGKPADLPNFPPSQARLLFQQALIEVLQTLASFKTHVIIVDDLHWADPSLWDLLAGLAPILSQNRLLLLLAYRRPEIEQNSGWETIRRWEREGKIKVISLKPLTEPEVAQILPPELQPELPHILASSGGNPFFITEMLVALAEGRSLQGDLILARVEKLSAPVRNALEAAAILGSDISPRLWAMLADLPFHTLVEAGEQLEAGYFLQPIQSGYIFSHDLIQAPIYEQIRPARRRSLHRRAADSLARLEPDNLRIRAFHLDRARAYAEAALIYRQAGEQDLARFAFKEAQTGFDRALSLMSPAPSQERVEILLTLAQVCEVTGERTRREAALAEALQTAQHLANDTLVTQAFLQLGHAAAQTGQIETAGAHLSEALALARRRADPAHQLEAFFLLGDLAARQGRLVEAREQFEMALAQAQTIGDRPGEARALRGLGIVARQTGQIEQAITWLEKALAVQQQMGDRLGASVSQVNLLGGFYYLGAWDRLLALAGEALEAKQALGDRLGLGIVREMQGLAAYALGDFEAARPALEQAIRDCEAVGERRTAGLTRNVLGLVAEGEGNLAEAKRQYEVALAVAQEIQAEIEAAYAQHDLGALYLRLDQPAEAVPLLEAAQATWSAQGNDLLRLKTEAYLGLAWLALGEQAQAEAMAESGWRRAQSSLPEGEQRQVWLWMLHRLLAALQRPVDANQLLQAAYAELQHQAATIADISLRRSFFERVPVNRAIVAAYDRLNQNIRYLSVSLARQDAPLGRPLAAEEMVAIRWTINAPDDEALPDKTARRRHRLQRLLQEAAAQGAAPTDADLASALGVSRRTILRDIESLARSGLSFATRRRPSPNDE